MPTDPRPTSPVKNVANFDHTDEPDVEPMTDTTTSQVDSPQQGGSTSPHSSEPARRELDETMNTVKGLRAVLEQKEAELRNARVALSTAEGRVNRFEAKSLRLELVVQDLERRLELLDAPRGERWARLLGVKR